MRNLLWMLLLVAGATAAADPVSEAVDASVEAQRAARESQQRVDQLDDQTRAMLEKYRAAVWQTQQVTAYAQQLEQLIAGQQAEKMSLQKQLVEQDTTEREILPLILRMLDSLEKFIALDLPFLKEERQERLASLKRAMADPESSVAEKYRRTLEAYQIEAEYGRTLGAESSQVDDREVEVLRVGRMALFYLTMDGSEAGVWDAEARQWAPLPRSYRLSIKKGLKIAREMSAPELLRLPMPVVEKAS